MSASSSPTTPKAKPADIAALSSPSSPRTGNLDRMDYSKGRYLNQSLGHRFPSARHLEVTQAMMSLPLPGNAFENTARGLSARGASIPMLSFPPTAGYAAGSSHTAPGGSNVRSSAGFKIGAVPGSYRSPFDHNMVHRGYAGGVRSFGQQYHLSEMSPSQVLSAAPPPVQAPSTSVPVAAHQIRAIVPPPGTPYRLVLLGPLRMIRGQCAKKEILRPILVWIDQHMGEELRTPVKIDPLVSEIVYAVNIPMDEEHWRDWNKVLAVFPHAAAWQEALMSGEAPFDQITEDHPTRVLFREGEELESLLVDLVETYNLGLQHDVDRPWELPGQAGWRAPEAREAHGRD